MPPPGAAVSMESQMASARVETIRALAHLWEAGTITWDPRERGWIARPEEIVQALASEGFQEYKCEVTRSGRGRRPTGGLWQGLNSRTGAVGSAVWIQRDEVDHALVFVDVDGLPVHDH
jgi:hypothetical protein